VACVLTGCSGQRRQQGEVFAAYLSILVRSLPPLKALPVWDQLPYFEAVQAGPERETIRLIVSAETTVKFRREWKDVAAVRQALPGVHPSTAGSLIQRSVAASKLSLPASRLPPELRVDLVSRALIESAFGSGEDSSGRWDRFYERYPGASGLAEFSSAGISVDGQQAAFIVERHHGVLHGSGYAVLMRRVRGEWAVEDHRLLWVS
jgi:hypothetical protein